ncbi:MAG: hydrogenase iron-sulfur subunit [Actinobacteria bacterium]|nr:hydrogenase iron-sulfur subunit [Actinomycetota bacterium]
MSANNPAPDKPGNGLYLVAFCCANSSSKATELSKAVFEVEGVTIRLVTLACSSKLEILHVLRALETGADGVGLWTCPAKACKFGRGSIRAGKRIERARRILDQIGLESKRVFLAELNPDDEKDLDEALKQTAAEMTKLGKSPLKT